MKIDTDKEHMVPNKQFIIAIIKIFFTGLNIWKTIVGGAILFKSNFFKLLINSLLSFSGSSLYLILGKSFILNYPSFFNKAV